MRVRHLLPTQGLLASFSILDSNHPLCYIPPAAMRPVAHRIYPVPGRTLASVLKKASGRQAGQYLAERFAGGI